MNVTEHQRLPEHDLLNTLIGRWITAGTTVSPDGSQTLELHASDVYEWVAGGVFVVHTAYGYIGETQVGGIEMIGYDPETGKFRTHFFDSQGTVTNQDLTLQDRTWTWTIAHARATGVLGEDGRSISTLHEWSDDGVNWRPSMDITLRKV
jgi:Protein of unknown function (DUF1579)